MQQSPRVHPPTPRSTSGSQLWRFTFCLSSNFYMLRALIANYALFRVKLEINYLLWKLVWWDLFAQRGRMSLFFKVRTVVARRWWNQNQWSITSLYHQLFDPNGNNRSRLEPFICIPNINRKATKARESLILWVSSLCHGSLYLITHRPQ